MISTAMKFITKLDLGNVMLQTVKYLEICTSLSSRTILTKSNLKLAIQVEVDLKLCFCYEQLRLM